jgi:trimeric autotransporter adhesin
MTDGEKLLMTTAPQKSTRRDRRRPASGLRIVLFGISFIFLLNTGPLSSVSSAQSVSSVAGGGPGNATIAVSAGIPKPTAIARDSQGNIFFISSDTGQVYKIDTSGRLSLSGGGCTNNGQTAVSACLSGVTGIAIDLRGNIYLADPSRDLIHRIDAVSGVISIAAGSPGQFSFSGDGGPAISAGLGGPEGIAVDVSGNIFIADTQAQRIRRVDASSGIISTVAGTGTAGFNGDGLAAINAQLNFPVGVAVDASGNLFIADYTNGRFRRVDAATGIIVTLATGAPVGVSVDSLGNAYFTEQFTNTVQRFDAQTLALTTVAGNGNAGFNGDGRPASGASLSLSSIAGLFVSRTDNIDIADTNNFRIREVASATGLISTIVGIGTPGDNGPATAASLGIPEDVATDSAGNIFIADQQNQRIRRVDASTGIIATVAGGAPGSFSCSGSCGDGGPATSAFVLPQGVVVDSLGNLFIADQARVRRVDAITGVITTVAGSGTPGFSGDGGPAVTANLSFNIAIALDASGNLLIADEENNRVRKVDAVSGVISTVAGDGVAGYNGDGIAATSASLNFPFAVKADASGNILIADTGNERVRKVDSVTGTISTVAGSGAFGFIGSNGDGGPAVAAALGEPEGLALDSAGNLFVADFGSRDVRRVDAASGVITTIAGNDSCCFGGDGGPATSAILSGPRGLTIDNSGNLLIADALNNRIRKAAGVATPATPPACSFSLSSTAQTFDSFGGFGSFGLLTSANCNWQLSFSNTWITPVVPGPLAPGGGPPRGTGSFPIKFQVATNPGPERTGRILVGNQIFNIDQKALICTFNVGPDHITFAATAGNATVNVIAPAGCSWSASTSNGAISIASGANGSGNGAIILHALANTSGGARSATISITGFSHGVPVPVPPVTVTQAAQAAQTCGGAQVLTSQQVSVSQQGFNPLPGTFYFYSRQITVTNISNSAIHGPFSFVFVGLPNLRANVRVVSFDTRTTCFSPQGDTYGTLSFGDLAPHSFVNLEATFSSPSPTFGIPYQPQVISGQPPL